MEMIIILINCKEIAQEIKDSIKNEISVKCRNKRKPILFVIQVGENEASNSYIKGKKKDCEEVGIVCKPVYLRNSITEHDLINIIQNVIALEECDGIIVQLPLPSHIDKKHIIDVIPKEKDVDGFRKDSDFIPCTPAGIMKVLDKFDIAGKDCLIINRSDIVGRPLVNLLLDKDATVTIAHSKTKDLHTKIKNADIIITAVGIPNFITTNMISNDKIFIDVSINRNENGKLCGDIAKETYNYLYRNSYITPVPNGIGLLTRAMLLQNTFDSYMKGFENK